jgi:molecular chaperone DnaJ
MFSSGRGGSDGNFSYRVYTDDAGNVTQDFGDMSELFGGSGFSGFRPGPAGPAPRQARRQRRGSAAPAAERQAERRIRAADGSVLVQRGHDVHSDVRLTIDQAILGTIKEIATVDGKASVKIPPGTSSGVKLRLKDKGALSGDGRRGSHFVTVHIDVPSKLDEEAKRLLVQLMKKAK